MKTKIQNLSIPLKEAKLWAETWQKHNDKRAKAFLIPIGDLIACLEEMDIIQKDSNGHLIINNISEDAAVRAYMANDLKKPDSKDGYGDKLLIVGTKKEGSIYRDIIQDEAMTTNNSLIGSGVYDLTTPCPSDCDPKSPLFF